MRKTYLLAAAAAAMFAACSSNESIDAGKQPAPVATTDQGAVTFDAYTQRGTSRAGAAGVIKTEAANSLGLKDANVGFGVFGYYTNNNEYDGQTIPDFFYNQKVYWDATYWKYEPVKYWPNEYGSSAIADDADKVSYFAYAPYVVATPSTGKVSDDASYGIAQLSRNSLTGDPYVKYIASFKWNQSVDLLWGVVPTDNTTWNTVAGAHQTFAAGLPWLDVERPLEAATQTAATQRVKFDFRHALSQLNVVVDYDADQTGHTDDANPLGAATRVYVRNVSFTGFAMKGALNLNNETPNKPFWLNYNGIGDLESDGEVIVYDGRKDGKEGVTGSEATNEKSLGLNKQLIETENSFAAGGGWESSGDHYEGVTNTTKPLFDGTGLFFAIPTDDNLEIEIVYDVETLDANLGTKLADNATAGSSIENRISKKISFGGTGTNDKLEAGKAYVINLHLGMNDVNFDAAVAAWEDVMPADIDLPANVPFYAASATGTGTATIPFNALSFKFGIKDLDGGEALTATAGDYKENDGIGSVDTNTGYLTGWNATEVNANTSGYCVQTLTTSVNNTTSNRTQVVTWAGNQSGKQVEMTITQLAAPLALKAPTTKTASPTAQLERGITGAPDWGYYCEGLAGDCAVLTTNGDPEAATPTNGIVVYRNGTKLNLNNTTPGAGEYSFTDAGLITFGATTQTGDIIKVVLKTGDAAVETISWKVE